MFHVELLSNIANVSVDMVRCVSWLLWWDRHYR
jgi:hypothetical protein